MPPKAKLTATCKGCKTTIGIFTNTWTQIGKNYYSPNEPGESVDVRNSGLSRPGESKTLVNGCILQDVCCPNCRAIIGLRCEEVPYNHVLKENQLLLREPTIVWRNNRQTFSGTLTVTNNLRLRDRGQPAVTPGREPAQTPFLSPKKKSMPVPPTPKPEPAPTPKQKPRRSSYQLTPEPAKDESKATTPGSQTPPEQPEREYKSPYSNEPFTMSAAELSKMKSDITRIDTAGFQVISAFDRAVSRIDGDVEVVKNTAAQISRDLTAVSNDISSVRTGLADVKSDMLSLVPAPVLETKMAAINGKINSAVVPLKQDVYDLKSTVQKKNTDVQSVKKDILTIRGHLRDTIKSSETCTSRVDALEKDLISTKKSHEDNLLLIKKQSQEIHDLQAEVKKLREEIETSNRAHKLANEQRERQRQQGQLQKTEQSQSGFGSMELDILTANLASVGTKAAMIETLQMEFQLFKSRFQRLEQLAAGQQLNQTTSNTAAGTSMAIQPSVETMNPTLPKSHTPSYTQVYDLPPHTNRWRKRIESAPQTDDDDDDTLLQETPVVRRLIVKKRKADVVESEEEEVDIIGGGADDVYQWSPPLARGKSPVKRTTRQTRKSSTVKR